MRRERQKFRATGFYLAAALIAYAVIGAYANDLYIPGRRGRGVHLHFEAIGPALLAITLFALIFVLDHFRKTETTDWIVRFLKIGAIVAFAFSLYAIVRPSGKEVATVEECRATFSKLASLTRDISSDGTFATFLEEEGARCPEAPILRTYYECIDRAKVPADVNGCQDLSKALFERKNAA